MRACVLAGSIAFAALATPAVLPAQTPPDGAELVRLVISRPAPVSAMFMR